MCDSVFGVATLSILPALRASWTRRSTSLRQKNISSPDWESSICSQSAFIVYQSRQRCNTWKMAAIILQAQCHSAIVAVNLWQRSIEMSKIFGFLILSLNNWPSVTVKGAYRIRHHQQDNCWLRYLELLRLTLHIVAVTYFFVFVTNKGESIRTFNNKFASARLLHDDIYRHFAQHSTRNILLP